jgi:hypothetical protein
MCDVFNNLIATTPWRIIKNGDRSLYLDYFGRNHDPYLYENNWAFVCQEARLIGVRYCDGTMLASMVSKDVASPNVILFAPLGDRSAFARNAALLVAQVQSAIGKRVIVRRAPVALRDELLATGAFTIVPAESFAYACDVPEDVFPQVIVDTNRTAVLPGTALQPARNHINHLRRLHRVSVSDASSVGVSAVEELVWRWQQQHHDRMLRQGNSTVSQADASAYTTFLKHFGDQLDDKKYFGRILLIDGVLSGFAFAARTSATCASLYASVCVLGVRGAADELIVGVARALADAGVPFLNLGGAETKGLHDFKRKYQPVALIPTYDLTLQQASHNRISANVTLARSSQC